MTESFPPFRPCSPRGVDRRSPMPHRQPRRNSAPRHLPAACLCVSAPVCVQRTGRRRRGRQVIVSARNRAAMHPFFTSPFNFQKTLLIRAIDKNVLLLIPAIQHMMNRPFKFQTKLPWPHRRVSAASQYANRTKRMTELIASLGKPLVRLRRRGDRAVEVRPCAVKSRAVSNRNCVVATRGGEQRNENDQSVTQAAHESRRRELDAVGVNGRVCERKTKPATRAIGEEPNRRAAGWSPVVAPMVGDGMAGSPFSRNQGDPPGSSGVQGGSARRAARRESERPE